MGTPPSVVAVFDFDHTLTDRDSLLPFLFYIAGFWKTTYYLSTLSLNFLRFLTGNLSRQEIKEKILTRFFRGWSSSDIDAMGKRYAHEKLDRYIKSEAMERLVWHKLQGHRCLLVSATLESYLKPWASRYGFENVLASRLELTRTGHLTGRLAGNNCWGQEKKRRLLEYLSSEKQYQLYVYGDSRGDKELLELANYPFYRTFKMKGNQDVPP